MSRKRLAAALLAGVLVGTVAPAGVAFADHDGRTGPAGRHICSGVLNAFQQVGGNLGGNGSAASDAALFTAYQRLVLHYKVCRTS